MDGANDVTQKWQLEIDGRIVPLGRELAVGRDPASDVSIEDDHVS
jgi:hypothetical protein